MSDLSLRLTITALENATKALERIAKQTEETNKRINKSNEYWANKDKREQEKHEHWKTNLAAREAEKRIRIEERANKQRRQALLQSEQDFRTSAQRLALYTTAPTAIMATLGMRAFMDMEQLGIKMKMFFGDNAEEMKSFAVQYAMETAFSVKNAVSLMNLLKQKGDELGIKSNQDVKDMTKSIGSVLLAYAPSEEAQSRFMLQFGQVLQKGKAYQQELNIFAEAGLNIADIWTKRMGRQAKGENEVFTREELVEVMLFMSKQQEVLLANVENAKSFTQAWGAATESITFMNAGLGKTLNSQFELTKHTKTLGEVFAKIGVELNKDENNLTKGIASYLTMLGLTVAPMLMLIGHWRKISFLIGESNMKGSIFARRLFYASSAMSALYLASTDWNKILEDIKENPLKGIITHLDTAIALGLTLSGAFMGMGKMIDLLNIKLLATNKTLGFIAKNPVIRMAGLAMMAYDAITDNGAIQKNIEKARSGGNSPLANLGNTPANNSSIEMLANLQSQPKIEVVNNINVDKSGNVSVDTKTKDKNAYVSPYSAPIMSDFSLGY